jgi:valyl-tRNA synthetase
MKIENESINFEADTSTPDKWILSRLQHTKNSVEKHLADYRLDLMSQTLYEFVWHDYCDWYLELSKPLLGNEKTKPGCQATLIKVLSEILTLLHPVIPFITEEIFEQSRDSTNDSSERLIVKPFPIVDEALYCTPAESEIAWLQDFILGIRQVRGEMNIAPGKILPCFIQNLNTQDETFVSNNLSILLTLGKLENITQLNKNEPAPESATTLVGEMKVLIPLTGLIDKNQEIIRLNKEINKLAQQQRQFSGKLDNEKFITAAPATVVEKERQKLASVEQNLDDLKLQLEKISAL